MKVSRGKQFEEQVALGFSKIPNTNILRLYDNMGGYINVSNPCDFIAYHYPHQFCLECKSVHGNTLNFKSDIRVNQWDGLLQLSETDGIIAGYLVWFIDLNLTVFVMAKDLKKLRDEGHKSLSISNLPRSAIVIKGHKRRILFDYDFTDFIIKTCGNL